VNTVVEKIWPTMKETS